MVQTELEQVAKQSGQVSKNFSYRTTNSFSSSFQKTQYYYYWVELRAQLRSAYKYSFRFSEVDHDHGPRVYSDIHCLFHQSFIR